MSNGEAERFKERLIAKGFSKKESVNYEKTFSHVVKVIIVRCLPNVDVSNKWYVYQLDINNAFLYGELVEDVYMQLPDAYFSKKDNKVCELTKSFYGLKQAPRKWNEKLTQVLRENGFIRSKSDVSLYTKTKDDTFIVLLVYVDDIIITGNNETKIYNFKEYLSSKFKIKDLDKLKYFLGIEVLETDNGLCLNHGSYCTKLLSEYGMLACKPAKAPIPD
ncbi:ribonuclease H-like domain-containing protein [Tanacetum coccineum]